MARPARPMFPATDEPTPTTPTELLADGALSLDKAAEFCSLCKSVLYQAIARGELETLYHGRKPLIPRKQVVAWLARKLEASRAERAKWT